MGDSSDSEEEYEARRATAEAPYGYNNDGSIRKKPVSSLLRTLNLSNLISNW